MLKIKPLYDHSSIGSYYVKTPPWLTILLLQNWSQLTIRINCPQTTYLLVCDSHNNVKTATITDTRSTRPTEFSSADQKDFWLFGEGVLLMKTTPPACSPTFLTRQFSHLGFSHCKTLFSVCQWRLGQLWWIYIHLAVILQPMSHIWRFYDRGRRKFNSS